MGLVFFGLIVVMGIFWYAVAEASGKQTRLRTTLRDGYQNALAALELDPHSVELRTAAIRAGRMYCEACREQGQVALFDEVAMSNDLAARTGKAGARPSSDVKICPECAEEVKAAARKCRFCGHEFEALAFA